MLVKLIIALPLTAALTLPAAAQFQNQPGNPFAPPAAKIQWAPDRDYDLINVSVDLSVDYPHRAFSGSVVDTLAPLRSGETQVTLDAGASLNIKSVSIDGRDVSFQHEGDKLIIRSGQLARDRPINVKVVYSSQSATGRGFGQGAGGWHWINERIGEPNHVGFWTQGETLSNRNWVPTWDYPNDFATSETRTTVPADWTVVGNGILASNTLSPDGKTRTFDWKMTIPHATYLISLVGGPFDVGHDTWRGVPLWYVVPKGEGNLIPESFGHTKDMLSFYSDAVGYKFPWPKYAQDAMFDFGGGMENVSATTLGEGSLTDERAGWYAMDSLNSHEMGHQWFGDTVTCKDWGQTWLNESFATYMQIMYFQHSRGEYAYQREIENSEQAYFQEARSYKRPIVTNFYSTPDAMFDSHTYPKGATILHTLRQFVGDEGFFAGLHRYLMLHQHTPVETNDLCEAMTDASGINCHPFFEQWLYKPGHPVIDTTWAWDDASKSVELTVKQTQDTSGGTPIYDVKTAVGIIDGDHLDEVPIHLSKAQDEFRFTRPSRPDAVLFDPEHNFLREIPTLHWAASELPFILRTAPNCIDKNAAMRKMLLADNVSGSDIQTVVDFLQKDNNQFPAIESFAVLAGLEKDSLRPFFVSQLNHPDINRRAQAIRALGDLAPNGEETEKLRGYVNGKEPYAVVMASMDVLAKWDLKGNLDVIMAATKIPSLRNTIRTNALQTLARSNSDQALQLLLEDAAPGKPNDVRISALRALGALDASDEKSRDAIRTGLRDKDGGVVFAAVQAALQRRDKALLPEIKALLDRPDLPDPEHFRPFIENAVKQLSG